MTRWMPLLLVLAAPAFGNGSDAEREEIFAKFNHSKHDAVLTANGIACESCHQVGARADGPWDKDRLAKTFLVPPEGACHQCHAPGQGGFGAGPGVIEAPHRCETCHERVTPPDTHGPGWLTMHGSEAQISMSSCLNCHTRSTCTECHDRREDVTYNIHDRTWLSVHGMAARAAPADCDSCHAQSECLTCHSSSAGFGRSK